MFESHWETDKNFWYINQDAIVKLHGDLCTGFPAEDLDSEEEHKEFIQNALAYCIYNDCNFDLDNFIVFLQDYQDDKKYEDLYYLVTVALAFYKMVDLEILTKGHNHTYVPTLEFYEQKIKGKKKSVNI